MLRHVVSLLPQWRGWVRFGVGVVKKELLFHPVMEEVRFRLIRHMNIVQYLFQTQMIDAVIPLLGMRVVHPLKSVR